MGLLLRRPARDEVRLPKGHIEPGEQAAAAALREVAEESGTAHLRILAPLGTQLVEFESGGKRYSRTEIYFLMTTIDEPHRDHLAGEAQFVPVWLSFAEAVQVISSCGAKVVLGQVTVTPWSSVTMIPVRLVKPLLVTKYVH